MIKQLIEIRNNILSALEQNDGILAKMAVNDLDTLLYKVSQEEKEENKNIEEAADRLAKKYGYDVEGGKVADFIDGVVRGAEWQAERMYSEEDLKEAYFSAISSTGEGWNAEYANGNNPNIEEKFSKGFAQWFEQFKKK